MNLLSGQTVFLTAVVTKPMRYIAVDREALRQLLFDDSEPLRPAALRLHRAPRAAAAARRGSGWRSSARATPAATRRLLDFARRQKLPHSWIDPASERGGGGAGGGARPRRSCRWCGCPAAPSCGGPSNGELSRALGIGLELSEREEVDLLVLGGGPAGLGAAVYGASEGLDTLLVEGTGLGGQAGSSRRIENYLGFPAGISGTELTSRAVTQARKFGARTGTPYRAEALEPGAERHLVRLEGGIEVSARAVLLATGAEYRRLPVEGLEDYEGISVFYAAGPPEAQLCGAQRVGVVGGGNSAAQAAVWLARGGALVTLLHRRADLRETMSHYLLEELERFGVAVRDRSEITALHGSDGGSSGVTLSDGAELPLSFLFLFLGAAPCTEWLGDTVARDDRGFILTGPEAGAEGLLETSVPGVYAAGDVRAGSIKRCATAVGEGADGGPLRPRARRFPSRRIVGLHRGTRLE